MIEAYKEAASLAPEDPSPLSNMSAVSFETGRYTDAVDVIKKALELSESEPDDQTKKQKLYARLIKSLLFTNSEEAEKLLSNLSDKFSAEGVSKKVLQVNFAEMNDLHTSVEDVSRLRSQLFDRLSRYKPYMYVLFFFFFFPSQLPH